MIVMTDDAKITIAMLLAIGLIVIRILDVCLADKEKK